jgi:cytochrome c553
MIAPVTVILGALLLSSAAQAEGLNPTVVMASACASCHGPDGKGAKKMPDLQDLELDDFIETMKGFQTGTTVMDRIAEDLTAEEIKQLANYFVGLKGR